MRVRASRGARFGVDQSRHSLGFQYGPLGKRAAGLFRSPFSVAGNLQGLRDRSASWIRTSLASRSRNFSSAATGKDYGWSAKRTVGSVGYSCSKCSAVSFARAQGGRTSCAAIFPAEPFELDLENDGNPLASYLVPLLRLRGAFHG